MLNVYFVNCGDIGNVIESFSDVKSQLSLLRLTRIYKTTYFKLVSSFACEVIENKMKAISKQKKHSDVVYNQGCRPQLERVIRKMPKNWRCHSKYKTVKLRLFVDY